MNSDKYGDNEKNKGRKRNDELEQGHENDREQNRDKKDKSLSDKHRRAKTATQQDNDERKSDLRDNGVKDKFNDNDRTTQTGIKGV